MVVNAQHTLILEDEQGRREFALDGACYSIGRDFKCDIRLCSSIVSRRHATLVRFPREDGSVYYRIIDGNSKGKPSGNGLLINGCKVSAHDLKNEDEIFFGTSEVRAIYLFRQVSTSTELVDYETYIINKSESIA